MSRRLFYGADPGVNGGLAVINKHGDVIALNPMPKVTFKKQKVRNGKLIDGTSSVVDEAGLTQFTCTYIFNTDDVTAAIEWVRQLPPKLGSGTNFSLGDSFGVMRGSFAMAGFKILLVPAKEWQAEMFPQRARKHDKAKSIQLAKQLFPKIAAQIGNHDGMAEALLLAEYARRKHYGSLRKC